MGDVVFGKHFGMLENEEFHIAVVMLRKAMDMLGPFTPVPWLAHIGFNLLPQLPVIKDWFAMMAFCHKRIDERSAVRPYSCQTTNPRHRKNSQC